MTNTRNSQEFVALKNEILSYEVDQGKHAKPNYNQWAQVAVNPVVIISNSKLRPYSQLQYGSFPAGFKDIELSGDDSFRLQFRADRPQTQHMFRQSKTSNKNCLPLNFVSIKDKKQENQNLSTSGFRGKKIKQSLVQIGQNLNKINQPLEQWAQPVNKTSSQLIPNQQITLTDVREALKTKKLNSSNSTNRADSVMSKFYKKRPKPTNHYSGFINTKTNNTPARSAQFTEYLKYEVIQSLVNRRLPFNVKDSKFETPEKTNSQIEIMGLYKELLCLQSREKKAVQQVYQDARNQQSQRKKENKDETIVVEDGAHDIIVIPLAQRTRTDSVLTHQNDSIRQSGDSPDLRPSIIVGEGNVYESITKTEFNLQPKVLTSCVAPESESRFKRQAVSVFQEVPPQDLKHDSLDFKQQHAVERISLMIDRKQIQKYKGNPRESVLIAMSKRDQFNSTGDQLLKTSQQLYNQRILLQSRDIKYSQKPFRVMKFDPKADYNKHGLTLFGNSDPICDFKQKLLVEQILLSFSDDFNGQLKSFKVFCKFNPMMGLPNGQFTSCFTIVTFGADSLISNCCSQLICFQFIQSLSRLEAQCLGSKCKHNPLTSVSLDKEFISLCFDTPNEAAQSRQKSRRNSQVSIPDAYQSKTIFDLREAKTDFYKTDYTEFIKQKRSIICKVPKVIQNLERVTTKDLMSAIFPEQKLQVQGHKSQCQKHRSIYSKRPSGQQSNPLNADILKVIKVDRAAGASGRQTSKSQSNGHLHSHRQKNEGDGEEDEHDLNIQSKRLRSQYARDLPSQSSSRAESRKQRSTQINSLKSRIQLTNFSPIVINQLGFANA